MKRLIILAFTAALFTACHSTPAPEPSKPSVTPVFAKGADVSWVSEMEKDGRTFKKKDGTVADIMEVLKETGVNAVRLRVWVNPEGGWSGKADMVKLAARADKAGLAVMVDFHYSDFFADPGRQTIPAAWEADKKDVDLMAQHVFDHTTDVLQALKNAGVTPAWVQVGNETRNGMLWPTGQLWTESGDVPHGRANFAKLLSAGYDATKAIFPSALVLAHLDNAYADNAWWFEQIKLAGGQYDAIALSHYPQTAANMTAKQCNEAAVKRIKELIDKFGVPVVVSEVGVKTFENETQAASVLFEFVTAVRKISSCIGVFYWEPEVDGKWKPAAYGPLGWNAYQMGAFTTDGKATSVMDAFK